MARPDDDADGDTRATDVMVGRKVDVRRRILVAAGEDLNGTEAGQPEQRRPGERRSVHSLTGLLTTLERDAADAIQQADERSAQVATLKSLEMQRGEQLARQEKRLEARRDRQKREEKLQRMREKQAKMQRERAQRNFARTAEATTTTKAEMKAMALRREADRATETYSAPSPRSGSRSHRSQIVKDVRGRTLSSRTQDRLHGTSPSEPVHSEGRGAARGRPQRSRGGNSQAHPLPKPPGGSAHGTRDRGASVENAAGISVSISAGADVVATADEEVRALTAKLDKMRMKRRALELENEALKREMLLSLSPSSTAAVRTPAAAPAAEGTHTGTEGGRGSRERARMKTRRGVSSSKENRGKTSKAHKSAERTMAASPSKARDGVNDPHALAAELARERRRRRAAEQELLYEMDRNRGFQDLVLELRDIIARREKG